MQCDEKKPRCGSCQKKNRTCTYDYATKRPFVAFVDITISDVSPAVTFPTADLSLEVQDSSMVQPKLPGTTTLVLRSSRREDPKPLSRRLDLTKRTRKTTTTSSAACTTASRKDGYRDDYRQHSLIPDPTSPEMSLVLRWRSWGNMICPGEPEPYLIGEYLEQMPCLIGHASSVDVSLRCAFASTLAVLNRSSSDYVQACELTLRTVAILRTTASTDYGSSISTMFALLALCVLSLSDVCSAPVPLALID